jgi:DNA-binding MarR family transcriptional regulator
MNTLPVTHSPPQSEVIDRLLAAREQISRVAARDFKRRRAPFGLTQTQFSILSLIAREAGMNMSHVAHELDLSVPTVVRAVDALERKSLVERRRGLTDAREVFIAATEAGIEAHATMQEMRRAQLSKLLSVIGDEDVQGLLRGYEALAHAVGEMDASATQPE